jgi:magnesium-transporting ATPase (P-type)
MTAHPEVETVPVIFALIDAPPVDPEHGLSEEDVRQRQSDGRDNRTTTPTSRSAWSIVRANVITRFNALLGGLCIVIVIVAPLQDALFGLVVVANSAVGIFTEMRAKRTLDRLQVITATTATVVRVGRLVTCALDEVVLDDIVEAHSGDQVMADGVVVRVAGAETDESVLTGESEPVTKALGDDVLSGSFVVAGTMRYRAVRVGNDSHATALAREARQFTTPPSELQDGVNTFLRWVTWALIPAGIILALTQIRARGTAESIRISVAAVVGMVPEGLVLLVSIAFGLAVVRLGRRQVLVQQLQAVETLARVDTVCLDKTGTLTEGHRLRVTAFESLDDDIEAGLRDAALGALAAADPSPNASLRAIGAAVPLPVGWSATDVVPFSSGRRWSGADFGNHGSWVLGAPDTLLGRDHASPAYLAIEEHVRQGRRVLMLASTDGLGGVAGGPPMQLRPTALITLEDTLRADAASTVRFFAEQAVSVKVLSGDHPQTVFGAATAAGIDTGGGAVDASSLASDPVELRRILDERNVFGRVGPQQKRQIVEALQAAGHSVAMIGDGVNDVPAMKAADLSVAMGSGTQAARAAAQIVLVDDAFASLPFVVREGRRVVANMERVAKLFISKSIYAFLLIVAVGIAGLPFPFVPRHLTLVGTLTIGLPAVVLALGLRAPRLERGFVKRVSRFAVPAGIIAAAATFVAYAVARTARDVSPIESRTTATMALLVVALVLVAQVAPVGTTTRLGLVSVMAASYLLILVIPASAKFFELNAPPAVVVLAAAGSAGLALWGLMLLGTTGSTRLRSPSGAPIDAAPDPATLAESGESATVEFKSSLRWDLNERKVNKALEKTVAKTIAGFLNGRGGTLLIGVDDAGAAVGLDDDFATLSRPDRDGFERHLLQVITAALGGQVRRFLSVEFADINGHDICTVAVRPADGPIYLRDGPEPRLYVRSGNATSPLALDDAVHYVGTRWPGRTTGHLLEALLGRQT